MIVKTFRSEKGKIIFQLEGKMCEQTSGCENESVVCGNSG